MNIPQFVYTFAIERHSCYFSLLSALSILVLSLVRVGT